MSKRVLNKEGESIFTDCNGAEFLKQYGEELLSLIEERKPATALDVEIMAHQILFLQVNTEKFNDLKKWVYESPNRKMIVDGVEKEYSVSIGDICFVLSIPLRDMYLDRHKELNI